MVQFCHSRTGGRVAAAILLVLVSVATLPAAADAQVDPMPDTSLGPSPPDPRVTVRSEADYTITFQGAWTTAVAPGGLPSGAHFSSLIGGVHNDQVVFLREGEQASLGVERMAELGGTSSLTTEINSAGANRLSLIKGFLSGSGPRTTVRFKGETLTTDHPRVTLLTMVAPSPDWFTGVSGLSLLDSSGNWKPSLSVNLYPWDAGTENGEEFQLDNDATSPRGVITSLRGVGKFTNAKIATLTLTLETIRSVPAAIADLEATPGNEQVMLSWTAPSAAGSAITKFQYRVSSDGTSSWNPDWTDIPDGGDPDNDAGNEVGYRVSGLMNGIEYTLEVRAVNAHGGSPAAAVIATPVGDAGGVDDGEDGGDDGDADEDDGDDADDEAGLPPQAAITVSAECAEDLCRARTGVPVTFEDTSNGTVEFRSWEFGDGRIRESPTVEYAWSEPGFHEVVLRVGDGTTESTASLKFLVVANEPAGTCEADEETLCLRDSRYAVEMDWWTGDGSESGPGRVVYEGTNASGLFYFFEPGNSWEVLTKVLNGCALNNHVWVYAASATTLGYSIRLTDTVTGAVREYRNEDGRRAPAITDDMAFPEGCGGAAVASSPRK